MQKRNITTLILLFSVISVFAQLKMDVSASYNMPYSTDAKESLDNGYGVSSEVFYYFDNSGFSTSILFGFTSFRANKEYEQKLEDNNPTIFTYDYEIHYTTFPLLLTANYTFFNKDKFNIRMGVGAGVQFMELKKKLIGKYVSDTHKDTFNEFAIYPNIGLNYRIVEGIAISVKGGYHKTFGDASIEYIDCRVGVQYDI